MEVRFRVHQEARASIHRWRARMRRRPGGQVLETSFYQMLVDELIRTAGQPEGVQFVFQLNPDVGVWEFQFRQTWVVFVRTVTGGLWARLLGRQQVDLLLVALLSRPPLPAQLASLARTLNLPESWRGGRSPLRPPG